MQLDDIARYRDRMFSDDLDELCAIEESLEQLAQACYGDFLDLCYHLLDDPEPESHRKALWYLYRFGKRDNAYVEERALATLATTRVFAAGTPMKELTPAESEERVLRVRAIQALGTVGTTAAYPILLACVEADEDVSIRALAKQARTEAQRRQALSLSREWLVSKVYRQREAALQALRILSTAEAEEDTLLVAYARYNDELVAGALGNASARMEPVLRDLLRRWPEGCAEYHDLGRALKRLQTRLAQRNDADSAL
jgi:hypothetical protein